MNASAPSPLSASPPTFAKLSTPKLVTILREGYGLNDLRADAIAGLTVAIVALPLSRRMLKNAGFNPSAIRYAATAAAALAQAKTDP